MNNVLDQAQGTIVNSTSVAFSSMWEDNESTNEDDLLRKDAQDSNVQEETEKEYENTSYEINDNIDYEIQSIEDEVEKIEKHNYLEETESEDQMITKNKKMLHLMETINNENNEIVR